jgi:hypothetical protein
MYPPKAAQTSIMVSRPRAPRRLNTRHALYLILAIVLLLTYYTLWAPATTKRLQWTASLSEHPIETLQRIHTAKFNDMLDRQSKTFAEANATYHRRYKRSPPVGFSAWFQYAQKVNSPIIDDYDTIEESLAPFRAMSAQQLREAVANATADSNARLWFCSVHDGRLDTRGCDWMGQEISRMLLDVEEALPDMPIILNPLDEPRVVLDGAEHDSVGWVNGAHKSTWPVLCEHPSSATAQTDSSDEVPLHFPLPFVQNVGAAREVCDHPSYAHQHGFLTSPDTFLYTRSPVPILSAASLSPFADIMYPSGLYTGDAAKGDYNEDDDPAWKDKKSQLYWAGSTTGSHAEDSSDWHSSHRQRFIERVGKLSNSSATFLTESKPGKWTTIQSQDLFSQLYDAKFTSVIQCSEAGCKAQKNHFSPGEREDRKYGFTFRFQFDIDGNSFSRRFYTLLRSKSAVLKQTIFKEWHDDRLVPWVHYVPISLDMGELPEVMRYLGLTGRGGEIAERVAEQGREWAGLALRREDMGVYVYRLLLELGEMMKV